MAVAADDTGEKARKVLDRVEMRLKKLEELWLKEARELERTYTAGDEGVDDTPFNILYSNTETLQPALFASTPRPEIQRRYTNPKPSQRYLDEALTQTGERFLEYFCDSNEMGQENFESACSSAVLDALVSGQGNLRVRYFEEEGRQSLAFCQVPYDRMIWGYARKWEQVPWVAFGHDLTREAFERDFAAFVKGKPDEYASFEWKSEASAGEDSGDKVKMPTTLIWEVWNHAERKIQWVSAAFSGQMLLAEDYPFDMDCRFPCAKPLAFLMRSRGLVPVPLYRLYKFQAEQLNTITMRLKRVMDAVRVRGVYNQSIEAFKDLLDVDTDNELIPSSEIQALIDSGGLDKHVWLLPLDTLVKVAAELMQAQMNLKQTIFEIIGVSDIQRGSSNANETAQAQEIKNRWGTLRMKKSQRQVSLFCRDALRVAFEFGAKMFTPATLQAVTQLPYLYEQPKQMLLQAQAAKAAAAQPPTGGPPMAPPAPQGGPPVPPAQGQPPQGQMPPAGPPPLPPGVQPTDVNSLEPYLQYPSWEEISEKLKNDFSRTYSVDVETNSTVDLEATEDKQQTSEFMNAFGQMMAGLKPLVESGTMDPEIVKQMLVEVTKRYRFGRRFEVAIENMKPPQPPEDGKAKLEAAKAQHQGQMLQKEQEITSLKAEVEQLSIKLTQKDTEIKTTVSSGKIRENELLSDHASKMRSKDAAMADKQVNMTVQQGVMKIQQALDKLTNAGAALKSAKREMSADAKLMQAQNPEMGEDLESLAGEREPEKPDPMETLAQVMGAVAQGLQQVAQTQVATTKMLADTLSRPKTVVRGADGLISGVH